MVGQRRLTFEDRIEQQARLERAAAAEFDDLERPFETSDDLAAVGREQIALDAGEVVLGQPGDRFEQRRPEVVVKVLRRDAARHRPQAGAHVFGKRRHPRRMRIAMEDEAIRDRARSRREHVLRLTPALPSRLQIPRRSHGRSPAVMVLQEIFGVKSAFKRSGPER
jgi:hypothetical protein